MLGLTYKQLNPYQAQVLRHSSQLATQDNRYILHRPLGLQERLAWPVYMMRMGVAFVYLAFVVYLNLSY